MSLRNRRDGEWLSITMSVDILFSSTPWIDGTPCLAPAILKSVVEHNGFSAKTIDLAAYVYQCAQNHPHGNQIQKFCQQQYINFDVGADKILADLIEDCTEKILAHNPKILGFSMLSQESQFFTMWLSYHIKHVAPDIKIIIGGSGVKNFIAGSNIFYAQELRNLGIIDDFIMGDGEHAMVEYLANNRDFNGINTATWAQIGNLDQFPFPNFDDYNFDWYNIKSIPICDSRGCVRKCEFCDIIKHWTNYKYRSGQSVFQEMLHQIEKHSIYNFSFYNSLTNGNMKQFEIILDLICDYNHGKVRSKQISWDGYFIVRDQLRHPERLWKKLQQNNAHLLLGVESVVEHVRIGLGKNFKNDAIDYHLEMAKKYNVKVSLLMIVGYPTETKADFEFTKKWFVERKRYAPSIKNVIATLAAILPGTELEKNLANYGVVRDENTIPIMWQNEEANISESYRYEYLLSFKSLLEQNGFFVSVDDTTLQEVT